MNLKFSSINLKMLFLSFQPVSRHFQLVDGASAEEHHVVADRLAEHLQPSAAKNAERVHHQVQNEVRLG
jgi:hypothetical protein